MCVYVGVGVGIIVGGRLWVCLRVSVSVSVSVAVCDCFVSDKRWEKLSKKVLQP